jgi:hypothetical protein
VTLRHWTALVATAGCLAAAPSALASGPGNIPFGNGSGGGAQTGSGSGSGGGGASSAPQGGGGGGTVTRTCSIGTFSSSTQVMPDDSSDAIVTQFAVPIGCPIGSSWILRYVNELTGQQEWMDFASTGLNDTGGGSKGFTAGTSGTEVFPTAAFATPYSVQMEIEDIHNQPIVTDQATIVTPPNPALGG